MIKIKYCIFLKIYVFIIFFIVFCVLILILLCFFIFLVIMREGSYDEFLKINFYLVYDYLFFFLVFGEVGIGIDGRDFLIFVRI